MKFYHATTLENMDGIVTSGTVKSGCDGMVYLCTDPIDACKFLVIRGEREPWVIEVDLNEEDVEESFDHSQAFFKCKAYRHSGDIKLMGEETVRRYTFKK